MQFWTSQSLKSTTHRVQIPPRQRFSIAYFVQPDPETVIPPTRINLMMVAIEANSCSTRSWRECNHCKRTPL